MKTHDQAIISAQALDLDTVLNRYESVGSELEWRLIFLEGRGDLSSLGTLMRPLEIEADSTPGGKRVTWDWLRGLAALLDDLIEFRALGFGDDGTPEVQIELFDSTQWELTRIRQDDAREAWGRGDRQSILAVETLMHVNTLASLRIVLPGDRRGEIESTLGIVPDSEKLVTSAGKPASATCWVKGSGLGEEAPVEKHLEVLSTLLEGRERQLRSLQDAGAKCDLFIGTFLLDLQGGFSLPPEILRRLADLELKLDFDIYGL